MSYPFYFQYGVEPSKDNPDRGRFAGAIATVIVFADSDERGRALASRSVARNNWNITEIMRAMVVEPHQTRNLDGDLKSLYKRAERQGLAVVIESWQNSGVRHRYEC